MINQSTYFLFKLRQNIALEGDLMLAKMELEVLLHSEVRSIAKIEDEGVAQPGLAHLDGLGKLDHHVRGSGIQAFAAASSLQALSGLVRRLSFVERIYCITHHTEEAESELGQMEPMLGPVVTWEVYQDSLIVQAIPHYALFELSDVVARHSEGADDTKRNLNALLNALLGRTNDRHAVKVAEDACAARSTTSHLSHDIHYYKAKFFPRLARSLLNIGAERLGEGPHRVLDNFVGSGTTLLEAATLGIPGVGLDIDPLSVLIARAKLEAVQFDSRRLEDAVATTAQFLQRRSRGQHGLFEMLAPATNGNHRIRFPAWLMKNRRMTQVIADDLSKEIEDLQAAVTVGEAEFHSLYQVLLSDAIARKIRMRFLGTGVGRFSLTFAQTPIARLFLKSLQQYVKVAATSEWLRETIRLRFADTQVLEADTRQFPDTLGAFDLLLTSPPYLPASSGRESYAKARAPSLIALGMRQHEDVDDLVDDSIGSMEGSGVDMESLTAGERIVVDWLRQDELRAPKAEPTARYFLDMRHTFAEMHRVLIPGAIAVIVSGKQSTFYQFSTRDALHVVKSAELLAEEAAAVGFEVEALHDIQLNKSNRNARPRALDDYYETLIVLRR